MRLQAAFAFLLVLLTGAQPLEGASAEVISLPAHRFALPEQQSLSPQDGLAPMDAARGADSSPLHPRGTFFLLQAPVGHSSLTVSEWDVATGEVVGSVDLPARAAVHSAQIVRAGDRLHVAIGEAPRGRLSYVRLTTALRIEEARALGFGYGPRLATDGAVVAIEWSEMLFDGGDLQRWRLMTVDAEGALLGSSVLVGETQASMITNYGNGLVVLGGKVFALAFDGASPLDDPRSTVVRLGRDARIELRKGLASRPVIGILSALGDRLLYEDDCAVSEWSPDLVVLRHLQPPYPPKPYPWCQAFAAASDPAGRLVTSRGDVLTPMLARQAHFADTVDALAVARPLWLGTRAALLGANARGDAWFTWADAP